MNPELEEMKLRGKNTLPAIEHRESQVPCLDKHATLSDLSTSPGRTSDPDLCGTYTVTHTIDPKQSVIRATPPIITFDEIYDHCDTNNPDIQFNENKVIIEEVVELRNSRPRSLSHGSGQQFARIKSILKTGQNRLTVNHSSAPHSPSNRSSRRGSNSSLSPAPSLLEVPNHTEDQDLVQHVKTPRFSSQSSTLDQLEEEFNRGKHRKHSLVSSVGRVLFRKLYNARLDANVRRQYTDGQNAAASENYSDDDGEDAPRTTCVSAHLSRPAQMATLQGYEDILCNKLSSSSLLKKRRQSTPVLLREKDEPTDDSTSVQEDIQLNSTRSSSCEDVHLPLLVTKHLTQAKGLIDRMDLCDGDKAVDDVIVKPFDRQLEMWRSSWRNKFDG